jgi:hypothetical protein
VLAPSDSRTLYRQFNRLKGIEITRESHVNIDEWLDLLHPRHNATLHRAVCHYQARTTLEEDSRFELVICDQAMQQAALKYCQAVARVARLAFHGLLRQDTERLLYLLSYWSRVQAMVKGVLYKRTLGFLCSFVSFVPHHYITPPLSLFSPSSAILDTTFIVS